MGQATQIATCKTCPFFNPGAVAEAPGECRVEPPKIFLFPVAVPQQQKVMLAEGQAGAGPQVSMIGQTTFPQVPESGWCGLHPDRMPYEDFEKD